MSKELTEKIPITVYGSDTKGEMFVEDTTTVLLAREYILVPIRKRIPPGSEVIVFNKTNGNQAEFLVEEQDAAGVYRARLRDLSVDVWERDFGTVPDPVPDTRPRLHLICKSCGTQESVRLEPEDYAQAVAGEVLWRHCAQCVEETDWQAADWLAEQRRLAEKRREEQRLAASLAAPPPIASPPTHAAPVPVAAPPPSAPAPPAPAAAPPPPPPAPEPEPAPPEPPPVAEPVKPAEINWAERRSSRRIHMKTRARVRRPDNRSEIVAPLNVSRGGIAFESVQKYSLDDRIQVALHYREGEQALETLGSIVRVSSRGQTAEYGVKFA
jgi:hypothetical protein